MTLIPDDDPELIMALTTLPLGEDFLPGVTAGEGAVTSARTYQLAQLLSVLLVRQ